MLYKGGILKAWNKKQAVALQTSFFETLPKLTQNRIVYTEFQSALKQITTADPGKIDDFIDVLQQKLDEKLEGNPPDAPALTDLTLT